ncbi:MAG: hypothetical protein ACOVNY_12705 [Chitinophagaceae bacterium]
MLIPFVICGYVVYALIREFFRNKPSNNSDAACAEKILKIKENKNLLRSLILFIAIICFAAFVNMLLFKPDIILDVRQLEDITFVEKLIFGFFYIVCHFLVIVFFRQLFSNSNLFVATTKGFIYTPAGISTGWILWEEVVAVQETNILFGSSIAGPTTVPVLGLKLRNPEAYIQQYNPALQQILTKANALNNFQTEGVRDLFLKPSDFGNDYQKVKDLITFKVTSSSV